MECFIFTDTILLLLLKEPEDVTAGARDGSINVLRCLKMWYDLSSDVFLISVNIIDRFLTKMKVCILLFTFIFNTAFLVLIIWNYYNISQILIR